MGSSVLQVEPPVYAPLKEKTILLGVTGGIAAYKAADYLRQIAHLGAKVIPVLTENAAKFVSPMTFSALAGTGAVSNMFSPVGDDHIPHISLARQANVFIILPATANILAKAAAGIADDFLSTLILSHKGSVIFCPSMNPAMYSNPATQANLEKLRSLGHTIVEPEVGGTACGEEGRGRLASWEVIREAILGHITPKFLKGLKILVTAGPTREPLDPIRYISNRSSGRMGYAIARVAARRGGNVTLVSGPVILDDPPGVNVIRVETAAEMSTAVEDAAPSADVIIMTAAVSDYRPIEVSVQKIKKGPNAVTLELEKTPDILGNLLSKRRPGQLIVGFCAETGDLEAKALEKLRHKPVDLLVANDVTEPGAGFDVVTNRVLIITSEEAMEALPMLHKEEVAERIWNRIQRLIDTRV